MTTSSSLRLPFRFILLARAWWLEVDLSRKLAGAASAAVVCGMALAANVATSHIKEVIASHVATSTALYMESFIVPHVQELATKSALSEDKRKTLASLFAPTAIGKPIVGFRIWVDDTIVFSDDRTMIGRRFALSPSRNRAWAGNIAAELDSLDGDDDVEIYALGVPILETYAPIRQNGTGQIIALAETYQIAGDLQIEVWAAQALVCIVLGLGALGMSVLLFGLAERGSRELARVYWENEENRARVSAANRRVLELDDLQMRQVGTDLYQGPMQLVGLALLRLDSLRQCIARLGGTDNADAANVEKIRHALDKALGDIRSLYSRLIPSRIKELSLADTIAFAVRRHEQGTGALVTCHVGALPAQSPFCIKACLYRFVQDGLCCHEACDCYVVRATSDHDVIEVSILSRCAAAPSGTGDPRHREMLSNLRDRVEALGGRFHVQSNADMSSMTASFRFGPDTAHG